MGDVHVYEYALRAYISLISADLFAHERDISFLYAVIRLRQFLGPLQCPLRSALHGDGDARRALAR